MRKPFISFASLGSILLLTVTLQWGFLQVLRPSRQPQPRSFDEVVVRAVPLPLRSFIRDLCWITADEYLHHDTHVKAGTAFVPGSFGGNPELLPLLRLCVLADPGFIDAWLLLAENQAFYFNRFDDGVRSLKGALESNRENPRRHELWAQLAFLYQFAPRYDSKHPSQPQAALEAIESALSALRDLPPTTSFRPDFSPTAYRTLQARLLVDLGRPRDALDAWKAAKLPLNDSSVLSRYLRLVETGASLPANPKELGELPQPETLGRHRHPPHDRQESPSQHAHSSTPTPTIESQGDGSHGEPACPQCRHEGTSSNASRILVQSFILALLALGLLTFATPRFTQRKDLPA